MSKKPRKVEEKPAPYPAKPAEGQSGVRLADLKQVRETNDRLLKVHAKVLEKLAR